MSESDNAKTVMTTEGISNDGLASILEKIVTKLSNAKALNGGFDALVVQVTNIEDTQKNLSEHVEKLATALYHPDDGLFARQKELMMWRNIAEKARDKDDKAGELDVQKEAAQDHKIEVVTKRVDDISKWKETLMSIIIWAGGGGAAAAGGLGIKILYTMLTGHMLH